MPGRITFGAAVDQVRDLLDQFVESIAPNEKTYNAFAKMICKLHSRLHPTKKDCDHHARR